MSLNRETLIAIATATVNQKLANTPSVSKPLGFVVSPEAIAAADKVRAANAAARSATPPAKSKWSLGSDLKSIGRKMQTGTSTLGAMVTGQPAKDGGPSMSSEYGRAFAKDFIPTSPEFGQFTDSTDAALGWGARGALGAAAASGAAAGAIVGAPAVVGGGLTAAGRAIAPSAVQGGLRNQASRGLRYAGSQIRGGKSVHLTREAANAARQSAARSASAQMGSGSASVAQGGQAVASAPKTWLGRGKSMAGGTGKFIGQVIAFDQLSKFMNPEALDAMSPEQVQDMIDSSNEDFKKAVIDYLATREGRGGFDMSGVMPWLGQQYANYANSNVGADAVSGLANSVASAYNSGYQNAGKSSSSRQLSDADEDYRRYLANQFRVVPKLSNMPTWLEASKTANLPSPTPQRSPKWPVGAPPNPIPQPPANRGSRPVPAAPSPAPTPAPDTPSPNITPVDVPSVSSNAASLSGAGQSPWSRQYPQSTKGLQPSWSALTAIKKTPYPGRILPSSELNAASSLSRYPRPAFPTQPPTPRTPSAPPSPFPRATRDSVSIPGQATQQVAKLPTPVKGDQNLPSFDQFVGDGVQQYHAGRFGDSIARDLRGMSPEEQQAWKLRTGNLGPMNQGLVLNLNNRADQMASRQDRADAMAARRRVGQSNITPGVQAFGPLAGEAAHFNSMNARSAERSAALDEKYRQYYENMKARRTGNEGPALKAREDYGTYYRQAVRDGVSPERLMSQDQFARWRDSQLLQAESAPYQPGAATSPVTDLESMRAAERARAQSRTQARKQSRQDAIRRLSRR